MSAQSSYGLKIFCTITLALGHLICKKNGNGYIVVVEGQLKTGKTGSFLIWIHMNVLCINALVNIGCG